MAMDEPPSSVPECREIAELLTDYIDGTLPPSLRELIDWHIDGCGPCVAFVNTFRSTLGATRRLDDVPPMPEELKQRLVAVLRQRAAQTRRERT